MVGVVGTIVVPCSTVVIKVILVVVVFVVHVQLAHIVWWAALAVKWWWIRARVSLWVTSVLWGACMHEVMFWSSSNKIRGPG